MNDTILIFNTTIENGYTVLSIESIDSARYWCHSIFIVTTSNPKEEYRMKPLEIDVRKLIVSILTIVLCFGSVVVMAAPYSKYLKWYSSGTYVHDDHSDDFIIMERYLFEDQTEYSQIKNSLFIAS